MPLPVSLTLMRTKQCRLAKSCRRCKIDRDADAVGRAVSDAAAGDRDRRLLRGELYGIHDQVGKYPVHQVSVNGNLGRISVRIQHKLDAFMLGSLAETFDRCRCKFGRLCRGG